MGEQQALGVLVGAVLTLVVLCIPFRMICAWCKGDIGAVFGTYENSHGICDECAGEVLSEADDK